MASRPEKRFGRYEVVSEIGRGAMGAVYKARDPKIDRFVAIKAISAISQSPEEEQEYRQRFFHEAQAAGRLVHPGIVTIFDVGEESETRMPYIVMEYVGGQSLSGLLSSETTRLPIEIALQLTEEIADALDCAHQMGVVHRDIKPANILLSDDGHAKIADFGIAKLNLSNVTLPGHALGTPAYMSPEQVDGRAVDGRSDLFSLGVILYNMVTGHRPFQGTSAVTVCYKVANWNPLPATSFDLALPPEVDTVINRAIAKDPSHRYQRGSEFAREVRALRQRLTRGSPASAPQPQAGDHAVPTNRRTTELAPAKNRPPRSNVSQNLSLFAAALVLLLALGVVLFGVPFHKRTQASSPAPQTALLPRPVPTIPAVPVASSATTPPSGQLETAQVTPPPSAKVRRLPATAKTRSIPAPVTTTPPPAPATPTAESVKLKIEVQHHFADGKLSLWVDEKLAYSTDLHGETKRHLALFHGIQGSDSAEVSVSRGPHTLRVNGQSGAHDFDESKTITADFVTGSEKVLHVNFEKNNREMRLALQ